MIVANNITKKYGDKCILKNFNYVFDTGIYLIKGRSGKGKTTLLNILSLKDERYAGKVFVDEGGVFSLTDKNNLVNNLTVKEHIKLFELINKKQIKCFFDLKGMINKKIKKLSLGERQLLLLTIVFNCNEKNIVLDEPLSALSSDNLERACCELEHISKNKTIILSTHNRCLLNKYESINLHKVKKDKEKDIEIHTRFVKQKEMKFAYLMIYLKKTFLKKTFFVLYLILTILSLFSFDRYIEREFDGYLSYFRLNDGVLINKKNTLYHIDEEIFYEVIKKLSPYVTDYNANYYNSLLYEHDIKVNGYYIDNGFAFSSVKYVEALLDENQVVLGLNYKEFCENNEIGNCDKHHVNTLLVNKEIDNFPYTISSVFETDDTVILSDRRFFRLYDQNEYEEYYFDFLKENKENVFEIINKDDLLANFEFVMIGENEFNYRYVLEVKEYKYFDKIDYQNYVVCLENGYNCRDYINHFNTLAKIDDFSNINELVFKPLNRDLFSNEIIISSKLSNSLNKGIGDILSFNFRYKDSVIQKEFLINDIVVHDEYVIYQNSKWSYTLFKELLSFDESDLRIKDILVYDDIDEDDYVSDDIYNGLIKEFREKVLDMKKSILFISYGLSIASIVILIILEIFQNKLKKEYFGYLKILNVK